MKLITILRILLVLIALHSLCAGTGLIVLPVEDYDVLGFSGYRGDFFRIQGGVFHVIMAFVYFFGGLDPVGNRNLVFLTVAAKFTATLFLLAYYLFAASIWVVLVSGLADMVMGGSVFLLYRSVRSRQD